MTVENGLLIDFEFCLGCCDCETVCMTKHDSTPETMGIRVMKLGPWRTQNNSWQYDFLPIPTDWCDMCADLTQAGQLPACVTECQYAAITYGSLESLIYQMKEKSKMTLFTPKSTDQNRKLRDD